MEQADMEQAPIEGLVARLVEISEDLGDAQFDAGFIVGVAMVAGKAEAIGDRLFDKFSQLTLANSRNLLAEYKVRKTRGDFG
jgi:hypothetical protein